MIRERAILFFLIIGSFAALILICFGDALFRGGQFGYRDAGHFYYPLYQRVQAEWDAGRWPLWEPEENSGMPLLGNPTAAVLYPGKVIYALLPYPWAARLYVVAHMVLAFAAMLCDHAVVGGELGGSAISALSLRVRRADPVPVLQHHLSRGGGLAPLRLPGGRPLARGAQPVGIAWAWPWCWPCRRSAATRSRPICWGCAGGATRRGWPGAAAADGSRETRGHVEDEEPRSSDAGG